MGVSFGYALISCERHPAVDRTAGELYRDGLALARRAEELGLDSVWTSEHHFVDTEYLPSPLVMAAAMAAVTSRIRVGTGVMLGPLYHPLHIAEDAATADLIAEGRLILGLGLGWSGIEFKAFGADRTKRARAMEELLDVLDGAARDDLLRHHGALWDLPEVAVRPKPARGRLTVWLGGTAEPAVRRAARRADGVFLHTPIEQFRAQMTAIREELERIGRDPATFQVGVYLTIVPTHDGTDGWHAYGDLVRLAQWKYRDLRAASTRVGEPLPTGGPLPPEDEAAMRGCYVGGSPDAIAEQLRAYVDAAAGNLHIVARDYLPGLGPAAQVELLERFAREVPPLFGGGVSGGGADRRAAGAGGGRSAGAPRTDATEGR